MFTSKVSSSHVITSPFILKNFNNLYIKGFSFGLKNFKISSSAHIPLAKILAFFIIFDFFLRSFALSFNSYLIECFSIVRSFCFCSSCNFGFLMGGADDFFFFFLIEEKLLLLLLFTFFQMSLEMSMLFSKTIFFSRIIFLLYQTKVSLLRELWL